MNRPHEVDSKVPQLRPQLPNPEIGNFKLRLQVAGVEAKLRHELRPTLAELEVFETPYYLLARALAIYFKIVPSK